MGLAVDVPPSWLPEEVVETLRRESGAIADAAIAEWFPGGGPATAMREDGEAGMATETYETDMAMVPYAPQGGAAGLVRPLVDHRAAAMAIREYEALKAAIVQESDVQVIQGRRFLKKAFWRRVATCFGLSLEMVSEARGLDEGGKLYYSVVYRAVAPNGRSMSADGYCSTAEAGRGGWPEHNVRATAHTRAKNRAISDLVGGGEVSAEELPEQETPHARPAPKAAAVPTMATLRKRMLGLGVKSMGDADRLAELACRKPTWEALTEADAPMLAAYIARKEREKAAAEAKLAALQRGELEAEVLAAGKRLGWREEQYAPHEAVEASEGQWRRFASHASAEQLRGLLAAVAPVEGDAPDLRDLDTGAPGN